MRPLSKVPAGSTGAAIVADASATKVRRVIKPGPIFDIAGDLSLPRPFWPLRTQGANVRSGPKQTSVKLVEGLAHDQRLAAQR
jgi:hypothetical protein